MSKSSVLWVVILVLGLAATIVAAPINGSLVLTTSGASMNGSNLGNATLITPTGFILNPTPPPIVIFLTPGVATGNATGDYTVVPVLTAGAGAVVDLNNINTFNITFGGNVGAFAASVGLIISRDLNFLDVLYTGTFTPGAGGPLSTFDPSPTSVRVSMNYSGGSVSYAGTMASPPEEIIPEPGTYALIGAGLLGLFLMRRKTS